MFKFIKNKISFVDIIIKKDEDEEDNNGGEGGGGSSYRDKIKERLFYRNILKKYKKARDIYYYKKRRRTTNKKLEKQKKKEMKILADLIGIYLNDSLSLKAKIRRLKGIPNLNNLIVKVKKEVFQQIIIKDIKKKQEIENSNTPSKGILGIEFNSVAKILSKPFFTYNGKRINRNKTKSAIMANIKNAFNRSYQVVFIKNRDKVEHLNIIKLNAKGNPSKLEDKIVGKHTSMLMEKRQQSQENQIYRTPNKS